MIRKFLIATHGAFAGGIRSSLELITGITENVYVLQAYVDGNRSIEEELDKIIPPGGAEVEWIVFSDLLGGSITNQLLQKLMGETPVENIHIVAGFNLALLIEIVLADPETPAAEVIGEAIAKAREQMVYVNPLVKPTIPC